LLRAFTPIRDWLFKLRRVACAKLNAERGVNFITNGVEAYNISTNPNTTHKIWQYITQTVSAILNAKSGIEAGQKTGQNSDPKPSKKDE
jgi:hypothetical protein